MSNSPIIPTSYEQWRECIEVRCQIPLTAPYIDERLTELKDKNHPKTKEFETLNGGDYLRYVVSWFERAAEEASAKT